MDGKQARRTKSSSALGQLFDHGCDCLGVSFMYIAIFSAIGLGRSEVGGVRSIALGAIGLEWGFFLSQWEEHYVHVLRTSVFGVFGVTELQFIFIGIQLATAAYGLDIWSSELPKSLPVLGGETLLDVMCFQVRIGIIGGTLIGLFNVGSTVGLAKFPTALKALLPQAVVQGVLAWIVYADPIGQNLMVEYPIAVVMVFAVLATHITNRIIIATVTRADAASIKHLVAFPGTVLFVAGLNAADAYNVEPLWPLLAFGQSKLTPAGPLFWRATRLVVVAQYGHFVVSVSTQIADHLGIWVFRLGRKVAQD